MRLKTVAVIALVLTAAVGCRAMTGRSLGENVDDKTLTAKVKTKLVADRASNLTRVDVDTVNGIVYLKGTVDTAEQRARAEQVARQVNGVTTVVNEIQVGSTSAGTESSTSGTR